MVSYKNKGKNEKMEIQLGICAYSFDKELFSEFLGNRTSEELKALSGKRSRPTSKGSNTYFLLDLH